MSIRSFFTKWRAFFFPVPGWRKRLLQFKAGCTSWDVPGRPEASKVIPWPVDWVPHRITTQEEEDRAIQVRAKRAAFAALTPPPPEDESSLEVLTHIDTATREEERRHYAAQKAGVEKAEQDEALALRGFEFLPCVCIDSGKEAPVGVGVLCVRCGVPLHPEAANMISGFDPPYCSRCRWPLLLIGR